MTAPVERRLPVDRQHESFYDELDGKQGRGVVVVLVVAALVAFGGVVALLAQAVR